MGLNYAVFGGTDGINYLSDVNLLDTENMVWLQPTTRGKPPTPRAGHCCVGTPEAMYVFGGTNGDQYMNDMCRLESEKMEWRRLESGGVTPTARAQASMCLFGNRLVVFGGSDGQRRLNDLHLLDLSSFKWHQPRAAELNAPHPRCGHSACMVGSRMIVFGGERDSSWPLRVRSGRVRAELAVQDVHWLDMASHSWSEPSCRGQMPPARCFHTATAIDDKVYVFGGTDSKGRRFNDLAILDTAEWVWSRPVLGGSAPLARSHHTTTFLGTSIFVFGGSAGYGKGCLSDFVRLEFDGLSSWSGPNIERLAIEHTVIKEQFGSLRADADAQRREHQRIQGCLDHDVDAAYQQLAAERQTLESVRTELDGATAEAVSLKLELDQALATSREKDQQLEAANAELKVVKLRVSCFEEQATELHDSMRDATRKALTLEAQLQVVTEEKQRLEEELQASQKTISQLKQDRQRAAEEVEGARAAVQQQERDSMMQSRELDSTKERLEAAENTRSKLEKNLEETMSRLAQAQVESDSVYVESRREFAEATTRYNSELAAHHSARASLEGSLEAAQRQSVQLQARVAEQTAVASVTCTTQQQLETQVQNAEADHRRAEVALLESRQQVGQLEGSQIQLESQVAAQKQQLATAQEELSKLQQELQNALGRCQERQLDSDRKSDRLEVELKLAQSQCAESERQLQAQAADLTQKLALQQQQADAALQVVNAQLEKCQEEIDEQKQWRVGMETEVEATSNALKVSQDEHAAMKERYSAQVEAFEELQQAKAQLRDQLQEVVFTATDRSNVCKQMTDRSQKQENEKQASQRQIIPAEAPHSEPTMSVVDDATDGVYQFLEANDCLEFHHVFVQHEIDADTIPYLTETDLIAMGVHSVGRRRKLLTLCHTAGSSPSASIASRLKSRMHFQHMK